MKITGTISSFGIVEPREHNSIVTSPTPSKSLSTSTCLTVVLLNYRRPENVKRLVQALCKQTVNPEIFLWNNSEKSFRVSGVSWQVDSSSNRFCWVRTYLNRERESVIHTTTTNTNTGTMVHGIPRKNTVRHGHGRRSHTSRRHDTGGCGTILEQREGYMYVTSCHTHSKTKKNKCNT